MYIKCNIKQFSVFKSIRQRYKINSRPLKTALLAKSAFGMAPKLYNKLPEFIREADMPQFKSKLFKFLTDKAFYSVNEYLNCN